jgi:hypothetical protein
VGPGAVAHDADGRRRFMCAARSAGEQRGWVRPSPWHIIIDLMV